MKSTEHLEEKFAFVICPVRDATEEEKNFIQKYIANLEGNGYRVHYPARDTKQDGDPIGTRICADNREAIRRADEIHVYWNGKSTGSLFDLGMSFMAEKPIVLFNRNAVEETRTPHKSFQNFLLELDKGYRKA